MRFVRLMIVLAAAFAAAPVVANPDVTSREYKLMLDPARFTHATEAADVAALMADAEALIEQAIGRDVTGSPSFEKQRDVRFFDTPATCELRSRGYSFRERTEGGDSEVTLKFRSPDRYISGFENLASSTGGAETKLEADVGAHADVPFKVVYGHSTKAPNSRTINEMRDVHAHFPGFETDYGLDDDLALAVVGNLAIREHVYRNVVIDLGQHDAEISVTLWFDGAPSGGQVPVVAELSFKYEDASADYTRKVVNRARTVFEALQSLSGWVEPDSITKTAYIYAHDAAFCQN